MKSILELPEQFKTNMFKSKYFDFNKPMKIKSWEECLQIEGTKATTIEDSIRIPLYPNSSECLTWKKQFYNKFPKDLFLTGFTVSSQEAKIYHTESKLYIWKHMFEVPIAYCSSCNMIQEYTICPICNQEPVVRTNKH